MSLTAEDIVKLFEEDVRARRRLALTLFCARWSRRKT